MNTYTPTGAVQKISDTVWSVPTASGLKYFTPAIDAQGYSGTESMPLRAGGGGTSTQIPWDVVQKGEFGRFGGGSLGFTGENAANNEGGTTMQPGWFFDTNPGQASYKYDTGGSFFGDVLGNFISGPGVPLGGFVGAGAFNSGGLGNFLGSFGGGSAGGAMDMGIGLKDVFGLGDVSWGVNPQTGGNMFDSLDFGSEYFDTPDLGVDLSGLEGMSSYNSAGNLINLNPLQQVQSWLSGLPNGTASAVKTAFGLTGDGSSRDISKLLGGLASAGLGLYGSSQQAKALTDIANQARSDRQPFLDASLKYLGNPDAYFAGPGKAAMDSTLRGLSASVGNPIGSPTAMGIATEAGLRDWRNAVTGFGNMGLAGQDLRANLQSNAAAANANGLNAIGAGLNTVLNPQPTTQDIINALKVGGLA